MKTKELNELKKTLSNAQQGFATLEKVADNLINSIQTKKVPKTDERLKMVGNLSNSIGSVNILNRRLDAILRSFSKLDTEKTNGIKSTLKCAKTV